MSYPSIQGKINPNIDLPTDHIINLLLASIAFDELCLAHIINTGAEKIQSVIGTLEGQTVKNPSVDELEKVDRIVERFLRYVIKKEIVLQCKLEKIVDRTAKPPYLECKFSLLTILSGVIDYVIGLVANNGDTYYGKYSILYAAVCSNCKNHANSVVEYIIKDSKLDIVYAFLADPATIRVHYLEPGKLVVKGMGTAVNGCMQLSRAAFLLIATDGAPDTFRMIINAEDNSLNHNSGVVSLTLPNAGEIEIANCCSMDAAEKHAMADKAKLQQNKEKIGERLAQIIN